MIGITRLRPFICNAFVGTIGAVILLLFTGGAATSANENSANENRDRPTLRVALTLPNYTDQFDQNKSFLSTFDIVLHPLFDRLMMFDRHGNVAMLAAKSVEYSQDGYQINVALKDDQFWNNGQRVVAGDYVRGLRRAAMADSKTTHLMRGIVNSERWAIGDYSLPIGIEAPDDQSIVIRVRRPFGFDLANLMNMQANPYPATPPSPGAFMATNGPYMLDVFQPARISLVRNPYYRGEVPYFDRIEFIGFSHDVAIDTFISQNADLLVGPLGKQKKWLLERYKSGVFETGLPRKYMLSLAAPGEHTPAAFTDAKLRRALLFALDLESFERSNNFFTGQKRCGFIPAAIPCSEGRRRLWRTGSPISERIREAKEAVKAAGYSADNPMRLTLVVATSIQGYNELALFIKSSWHEIWIDTQLVEVRSYADAIQAMKTGSYDMMLNSFYQLAAHQYVYRPEGIGDWSYSHRDEHVVEPILRSSRNSGAEYEQLVEEVERNLVDVMTILPLASDSQAGLHADWISANQENVAKINLRYFAPK